MSDELNRWEEPAAARPVTLLPMARYQGKEHAYALTVDISNLTDVTKPQAKVNIVVDNKVIRSVTIHDMINGYFSL